MPIRVRHRLTGRLKPSSLVVRPAATRSEHGSVALEFALVAPILLLLLFTIVEFARFVSAYSGVETASRESARYGSAVGDSPNGIPRYADCDEIRAAGIRLSGLAALGGADIDVTYDGGPGTGVIATCPGSGSIDAGEIASGDRVVVTSTTTFDSIVPFIDDIAIRSTERRTIFRPA